MIVERSFLEMERKNIFIFILSFIIVILSSFILYDKLLVNNTNNDYNNIDTENSNYQSTISVDDIFAITNEPTLGKRFFILHNGNLYYDIEKCDDDGYCNYLNYNLGENSDGYLSKLKVINDISNVKRIKSYNNTTGVDWSLFLITENGEVYNLYYNINNNDFELNKVNDLSRYKIDDIIDYNISTDSITYEIVLIDGTTLTETITYHD